MKLKKQSVYILIIIAFIFIFLVSLTSCLNNYEKLENINKDNIINVTKVDNISKVQEPLDLKMIAIHLIFLSLATAVIYFIMIKIFSASMKKFVESIHKFKEGDYSTRFSYHRNNDFGEIVSAYNQLMDTVESNTHALEQGKLELEAVVANIPGGVHRCTMVNGCEFKFVSQSYLKLIGYTHQELVTVFHNKFINTVYEKDRHRVNTQIELQLQFSDSIEIEYRIVCSDDRLLWILDKRQVIVDADGTKSFYCVLVDITTTKKAQEELRRSEERYRIIIEQTDDIIIEWDFITNKLTCSSNWDKISSSHPLFDPAYETLLNTSHIHPDDKEKFTEFINFIYNEHKNTVAEFRIKHTTGNYFWVKARITIITDQNNIPIKAVGVLSDITPQKQEIEHLKVEAQTDPLTGLFNKSVTQELIDNILLKGVSGVEYTLIILDIDNFKTINDQMGHLIGDIVIGDIAKCLNGLFRSTDIIGRIGGDEFIIFIQDLYSHEFLHDRLESIRKAFSEISIEGNTDYKVSSSLGVAFFPQDGKTYRNLLRNADIALYRAKKLGKDQYCIYDISFEDEWPHHDNNDNLTNHLS